MLSIIYNDKIHVQLYAFRKCCLPLTLKASLPPSLFFKLLYLWARLGLHYGGRTLWLEQARGPSAASRSGLGA